MDWGEFIEAVKTTNKNEATIKSTKPNTRFKVFKLKVALGSQPNKPKRILLAVTWSPSFSTGISM
jgi:hypothetical protein